MLFQHLLDARTLDPPEPFVQACDILSTMKVGEYLLMRHRRVPYPLFDFCTSHSLEYAITQQNENECTILIYFRQDQALLKQEQIL